MGADAEPDEFDRLDQEIDSGWEPCDPTSHLIAIRLINRAFTGQPQSEIQVRFKARTTKAGVYHPECVYRYLEPHDRARDIFGEMQLEESPGEVLDRELIKKGNRGTRIG